MALPAVLMLMQPIELPTTGGARNW